MKQDNVPLDETVIDLQNHETFYAIALRHYRQVQRLVRLRERRPLQTDADADFNALMNARIQRSAMVVVIFSALTLEAYINHYGIERLSDTYFDRYVDRLSPTAKWVVIPRLVLSREIKQDGQAFELLVKLFRLRNKLVHYKTRKKKIRELTEEEDWITEHHAQSAVRAVSAMIKELRKIDSKVEYEWLRDAERDPFS